MKLTLFRAPKNIFSWHICKLIGLRKIDLYTRTFLRTYCPANVWEAPPVPIHVATLQISSRTALVTFLFSASRRAPIGQWYSELYEHLLHPLLHHWVHAQAHLFWMQGKTSRPQGSGNLVQIPLGLSLLCFLVILVMDWLLFSISMLTCPSYGLLWIYF